jgi:DNA repair exonuclease SbcCD nuclease subunit
MKHQPNKDNIATIPPKPVFILGDWHGEWNAIMRKINFNDIKECILIGVGDAGIGFSHPVMQKKLFLTLNEEFKEKNIEFMTIHGNHDDPSYFDGSVDFSHFKLLPNYSRKNINGQEFLFVGGATSIDRRLRVEGLSDWSAAKFTLIPEESYKCDVLITHSAPSWIGPTDKKGLAYWLNQDQTLWEELLKERGDLNTLFHLSKPSKAYMGHFHLSETKHYDGCYARILDINEIYEHTNNP